MGFQSSSEAGFRSAAPAAPHPDYAAYVAQQEFASMKAGIAVFLVLVTITVIAAVWLYRRRRAIGDGVVEGAAMALQASQAAGKAVSRLGERVQARAAERAQS